MFNIAGTVDSDRLYCAGSLTKLFTTYVCLSLLNEDHHLNKILDDEDFFSKISTSLPAKNFLSIFQNHIGSKFSLHDLCSHYTGLPYTFDVSTEEITQVEKGFPFKHHSILNENTFLEMCRHHITPVYPNRSKFHYSELSIIFLGYLIEKIYLVTMEDLYQKYLIDKFQLTRSCFSRVRPPHVFTQDLSHQYDYPAIAILDHGYFSYSNGFYTTLNEMKRILTKIIDDPLFKTMTAMQYARAASLRIMNGLSIEIRQVKDDIIYGYEGLSFSGCNLWAYSTLKNEGFLTTHDSEEKIYEIIYEDLLNYSTFDVVPEDTQKIYQHFLKNYQEVVEEKEIPKEYQGQYHRVRINESQLNLTFTLGSRYMVIRNPDEIKYNLIYANKAFRVKGKDGMHAAKVGLIKSQTGNHFMYYDGTLYKKI